nr:MAG TPA: hypothetical protein [Caudoviricetes sp.]
MADAILMAGGTGGVSSDDVTAGKAQVLQGYRTITSDSDDEVVEGTIPDKGMGNINARPDVMDWGNSRMSIVMQEGYYHGNNGSPWVWATFSDLQKLVKIAPSQVLETATYLGVKGGIKVVNTQDNNYTVNQAKLFGMDPSRGKLVMQLGHGNAYYYRNDNSPHVEVDASVLGTAGADSVLQWQTASSQQGIKFEGSIPRWICTTGGVITALNGEGFVWDDSSGANRGRGIVTRIPDKHFIQDASYVFLASPNFYPQNLVKNININGITGTRDYIDSISPTWLSDTHLNLTVNAVEKEIHIPNKFQQYNGLFLKVIIWGGTLDGYYKNSNGGACPCVLAVTNWDGGAAFEIKIGTGIFYGLLERQGNGFNNFRLKYRGTMNFNLSMNFLITEGFSHQWAGNYAT